MYLPNVELPGYDLDAVVGSPYGIKVLQYLLAPRSTKYNMPDVIKRLQLGDGNKFTKKDVEQRRAELRKAVLPALVKVRLRGIG